MGQVHPLPTQSEGHPATVPPTVPGQKGRVRSIESVHCALCGSPLGVRSLRYHVVSPQQCEMITVCHTCHNAALGEGYRPAE
jgi:hypothetical protein